MSGLILMRLNFLAKKGEQVRNNVNGKASKTKVNVATIIRNMCAPVKYGVSGCKYTCTLCILALPVGKKIG